LKLNLALLPTPQAIASRSTFQNRWIETG